MSGKQAEAALAQLLYFCTPERLASFTAAHLAATHKVSVAQAEKMLADARRMRAA